MNRRTMILGSIGAAVGAALPKPETKKLIRCMWYGKGCSGCFEVPEWSSFKPEIGMRITCGTVDNYAVGWITTICETER